MIPAERLRALRNDVPVFTVIFQLGIPTKMRQARLTFRCPACGLFSTATTTKTNLAHCFSCRRSFNTIDIVMAERSATFLEAVEYVECLFGYRP